MHVRDVRSHSKNGLKQVALKLGENTIGRKTDSSNLDIEIEDEFISRAHASIFIHEKDNKLYAFICDNNSLNATFNQKKAALKPGLKYPMTSKDYYIIGLTKLSLKFN